MKKSNFNLLYCLIGIFLAIGLIEVFWFLNQIGIINSVEVSANSNLLTFFVFGVLASISSCAVFTGLILLGLADFAKEVGISKTKTIFSFQIGRIVSFAIFGFGLGYLGEIFTISPTVNALLLLIISILMLAIGLNFLGIPTIKYLPQSKKLNKLLNTSKKSFWWFLLIGVITFFLPCGFTYTTQLLALSSGNGVRASLIMLSFVLGTTPILTVIGYSGFLINSGKTALGQILNYFIGGIIVIFALISLNFQLGVLYFPNINISGKSTTENNIETPVENGVIYMTYTKAGLSHSVIKLEAGKDYKIVISVKNTIYGCMSTIFLKGLDDKIQSLKAGTTVEFNIKQAKKGTYWFLCAMGAKHNAKVVVE